MITNGFTRDSIPHSPARNELLGLCGISSRFFHELLYKIPLPTSVSYEIPSPPTELGPVTLLVWQIPPVPAVALHEDVVSLPPDRSVVLRVHFDGTLLKWLLLSPEGVQKRNNWDVTDPSLLAVAGIAGTTLKELIVEACGGSCPRPPDWLRTDQYDTRDFYDYF